ncbi:uncharacterized protein LOC108921989 isoform X2 [Scleropages formosus]|uniref:uncharacterized protein LOC108921989 isoform X2 n=1 Tax=Scleropages formosus TaxID=113540 RepID=UPI000878C14A|nr:uncharacterized protein LOC108921989 isoform X2 [Scleropages formosus]
MCISFTGDQFDIHHGLLSDAHGVSQHGSAVAPAAGVADPQSVFSHTYLTGMSGGAVTSSHTQLDVTVREDVYSSGPPDTLGLGEAAVTGGHTNTTGWPEPQGALLRTETPVAGEPHSAAPHTDATDAVTADPKGVRDGFSHLGTTPQTQSAVPAGEQYITSGQGPEGAENVELEDTC